MFETSERKLIIWINRWFARSSLISIIANRSIMNILRASFFFSNCLRENLIIWRIHDATATFRECKLTAGCGERCRLKGFTQRSVAQSVRRRRADSTTPSKASSTTPPPPPPPVGLSGTPSRRCRPRRKLKISGAGTLCVDRLSTEFSEIVAITSGLWPLRILAL